MCSIDPNRTFCSIDPKGDYLIEHSFFLKILLKIMVICLTLREEIQGRRISTSGSKQNTFTAISHLIYLLVLYSDFLR